LQSVPRSIFKVLPAGDSNSARSLSFFLVSFMAAPADCMPPPQYILGNRRDDDSSRFHFRECVFAVEEFCQLNAVDTKLVARSGAGEPSYSADTRSLYPRCAGKDGVLASDATELNSHLLLDRTAQKTSHRASPPIGDLLWFRKRGAAVTAWSAAACAEDRVDGRSGWKSEFLGNRSCVVLAPAEVCLRGVKFILPNVRIKRH